MHPNAALSDARRRKFHFLISAWLEENSADRSKTPRPPLKADDDEV